MRVLSMFLLACAASFAFAHENPSLKGQCFVPQGKQQVQACQIDSGGGAGGMYTTFKIGKQTYLIEESLMCDENTACTVSLGSDPSRLKDATTYQRNVYTKREVPEGLYDQYWSCVRQIKGKMDVCYRVLP